MLVKSVSVLFSSDADVYEALIDLSLGQESTFDSSKTNQTLKKEDSVLPVCVGIHTEEIISTDER